MKVSIIIVNFNGAGHLPQLFDSIHALDYPQDELEVIFCDNGSSDGSLLVVERQCPEAVIIANSENLGFAAPHRIAARKAQGEVLAFLNNDMRVHPDWVREGLSYLDPDQGVVCAASQILAWDGQGIDFSGGSLQYLGYALQFQEEDDVKDGAPILFPCGGAMFIYKETFLEAGCFDDDYFAIFEDVDLGWRLWLLGYKVLMAKRSITYHKGHATLDTRNEVQKRYLMHRNALVTIIKNYEQENLEKILPAAMNLALKRALLFLGLDKHHFYFWEKDGGRIELTRNSTEGLLHLVVLDDVFEDFENIACKRKTIQAKRRRMDKDILELFGDPLRNIMGFKEYFWQELSLIGNFHLHELFLCRQEYQESLAHGLGLARQDLQSIRRAMDRGIKQSSREKKVQGRMKGLVEKFCRRRQEQGLARALRASTRYCFDRVCRRAGKGRLDD